MNRRMQAVLALSIAICTLTNAQRILFDDEWLFHYGDTASEVRPGQNNQNWRHVELPHDWSIEDLPGKNTPFNPDAVSGPAGGYTTGGTGWYKKSFKAHQDLKGKRVLIYFEGIYMNAEVWVNDRFLGFHPYGYTGFWYDLTGKIRPGEENSITVKVRNEGRNSRWYSGSGIYRHVWLVVLNPVHIDPWSLAITTTLADNRTASLLVSATIRNDTEAVRSVKLVTDILSQNGALVISTDTSFTISGSSAQKHERKLTVSCPEMWSVNNPVLYSAKTSVYCNDSLTCTSSTTFGIRTITYSPDQGLLLNGRSIELRGGCIHHDNGLLGAAAIDRAEERKVELLKAHGFNAVRCAHNPPSEKFLEACDRLGLLVIDEAFDMWKEPKNPDDYHLYFDNWWEHDLTSMILRDRNHPSVIMWSMGNEISERADSSGVSIMKNFRELISRYDTVRPLTLAVNEFWDHPGRSWDETAPAFSMTDIAGYNYQWWQYEPDHVKYPDRVIMGTESVPVHAFQNWHLVERHPYVIGDFVWTAMDYLGEAGIGHTGCEGAEETQLMPYPWFNAWCGDIDLTGMKKPQSFYRDVVWRRSNIEMAVHAPLPPGCRETVSYWGWPDERQSWTWDGYEGETLRVNVYSRYSKVKLELNGRVIGVREISDSTLLTASFDVPYEPGTIAATGWHNDLTGATVSLTTSGAAKEIRLRADRNSVYNDRNDLAFVIAELIDDKGNVVQADGIEVTFTISGPGGIIATGNAKPAGSVSFRQNHTTTFRGRCMAVIRPGSGTGNILLSADSPGLIPPEIIISAVERKTEEEQSGVKTDDPIRLLLIGDSNTEIGNITCPLKMMIDSLYGNSGSGYCTLNTNSIGKMPEGLTVSLDSAWTTHDMRDGWVPEEPPYLAPDGLCISSSRKNASVRIRFSGRGIDLYYLDSPSKGVFTVSIDGKRKALVRTGGISHKTAKTTISALTEGDHEAVITLKSGRVTLLGFETRKGNPDARPGSTVHKWGNSWASSREYTMIDSTVFSSALTELRPTNVVIMLGTNDHNLDKRDPVEVRNNLEQIINRIKTAVPGTGILLVSTISTEGSETQELLPLYLAVSYPEAAQKNGTEYWDMNEWFGHFTPEKLPDGVHISEQHGRMIAERMLKRVLKQ